MQQESSERKSAVDVFRYKRLTDAEKIAYNKRHHKKRREYYREREAERGLVRTFMREHPEEVEAVKKKHAKALAL